MLVPLPPRRASALPSLYLGFQLPSEAGKLDQSLSVWKIQALTISYQRVPQAPKLPRLLSQDPGAYPGLAKKPPKCCTSLEAEACCNSGKYHCLQPNLRRDSSWVQLVYL